MSNFEIREQMKRTKLFFDGKYVAAFNDCMWHPYIYPFCTPQGVCVIHEASVDHPFHNGIFFAHRCVAVREWDVIDFWVPTYSPSAVASSGRVICRERTWAESGENTIEFREHSDRTPAQTSWTVRRLLRALHSGSSPPLSGAALGTVAGTSGSGRPRS